MLLFRVRGSSSFVVCLVLVLLAPVAGASVAQPQGMADPWARVSPSSVEAGDFGCFHNSASPSASDMTSGCRPLHSKVAKFCELFIQLICHFERLIECNCSSCGVVFSKQIEMLLLSDGKIFEERRVQTACLNMQSPYGGGCFSLSACSE